MLLSLLLLYTHLKDNIFIRHSFQTSILAVVEVNPLLFKTVNNIKGIIWVVTLVTFGSRFLVVHTHDLQVGLIGRRQRNLV